MARTGYLGGPIIRPGAPRPDRVGPLVVSNIPRSSGLASHVAEIKRQNIVLDAAAIVARRHGFLARNVKVELAGARSQHFGATGGQHAAHAVKRYLFGGNDIVQIYAHPQVDELACIGLATMLGLVIDVDRRANLSIDKRLETAPQRVAQLQTIANASIQSPADARRLARDLELNRRNFEPALLQFMRGGFDGDASYAAMLVEYTNILSAPPAADEAPALMIDMVESMIET
jgi:hypothetical protein